MAKKKKRQKKKPVKQMGKITTGLWEQAFIVASLPQFVDCRISEWDAVTGGTQHRIGEWIGINGDLSHIMGLLANAQDIEAMNHMSSAQISSLLPYMKLEKKPTKEALELIPDLPKDPIEIKFDAFQSAQDILASRPKHAGIVDIRISQKGKWKDANHAGSEVDLKFTFDSMKTFSENQTGGVSFMDLIPGLDAMAKSAGTTTTLYQLILTVGWSSAYGSTDTLFSGPQGDSILQAISRSVRQYTLQYGGEHSIDILPEGSVELSIKYLPVAVARKREGMNAELREDIMGGPAAPSFVAIKEEIQDLEKTLDTEKQQMTEIYTKINKAKQDLHAEKRKMLSEAMRAKKADEDKGLTEEEKQAKAVQEALDAKSGNWYGTELDKIEAQADAFAASYVYDPDAETEDVGFWGATFDGDEIQDAFVDKMFGNMSKSELKEKMDEFHKNFQAGIDVDQGKLLEHQSTIKKTMEAIAEKKKFNTSEGLLNDRYSNLVRQMVEDGTMRYLDISAYEQKKAFSARKSTMDAASKKFREKVLPDLLYEGALIDFTFEPAMLTEEQIKELSDHATQSGESLLAYPKNTFKGPGQVRYLTDSTAPMLQNLNPRKRRVYYFYLGDMLDIVMQNWYKHVDNTSAGESHRQDRLRESLVLGNFYYVQKKGKKEVATAYHMGDFPISFYAFNDWFVSNFVRRGVNNISLSYFLSTLADEFFNSHPALVKTKENQVGPFLNSKLPDQPFEMVYDYIATDGQIPRGMDQRQAGGLYEASSGFFQNMFKAQKEDSNEPSIVQQYGYHFFGPSVGDTQVPPVPTYTLHMGSEHGFLKSVKYNKTGGGKAARTLRIVEGGPKSKLGMPGQYDVSVEMLGAAFAQPNQIFDLNNNVFGIIGGRETLDTTLPRILRITEVEHKISNGEFTTSLKCFPTGQVPRKYINHAGEVIGEFERPGVANKKNKKKNKSKKAPHAGGTDPKGKKSKAQIKADALEAAKKARKKGDKTGASKVAEGGK